MTASAKKEAKSKRIDESNIAKLVAEENEIKSKFPRYPKLDRWKLLEKMGDGAFSNVYRALDRHGQHGEVAIKVVRKYEMNSMQVSREPGDAASASTTGVSLTCLSRLFFQDPVLYTTSPSAFYVCFTNQESCIERQAPSSGLQEGTQSGRGAVLFS